jgi:hypothetical protein
MGRYEAPQAAVDGLRLIATALVPIVAVILLVWNADGPMFLSVGIGLGCLAAMLLLFFASKRIEKRRLQEHIERCRLAFRESANSR